MALDAASGCLDPFGRGERIQLAGAPRHPQPGIDWYAMLRRARIEWWRANVEVVTAVGKCVTDVLFDPEPLVLEVDSWGYHASQAFELDRRKQNGLMLSGYRVLRFTAAMITGEPTQVIGAIQALRWRLRGC